MISKDIYRRTGDISWETPAIELLKYVTTPAKGLGLSVSGKHGFGKSTFLEVIAHRFPKLRVVESDMLWAIAYGVHRKHDLHMTLSQIDHARVKNGDPWGAVGEQWIRDTVLWDSLDVWTNFAECARRKAVMVPQYDWYVRNLQRRTRVMLSSPVWAGYTADHWPVLSKDQFEKWVRDRIFTEDVTICIPNISRKSDSLWVFLMQNLLAEAKDPRTR